MLPELAYSSLLWRHHAVLDDFHPGVQYRAEGVAASVRIHVWVSLLVWLDKLCPFLQRAMSVLVYGGFGWF